ncbi:MAG: LysM domain-containing protein [Bacilli bacterium]|nr:LysM domain-containing protein [Bacilli bacterium]
MNEVYVLDKEFLFKNNIHAITSISIEHCYDIENSNLIGEFTISGDYHLHEVSINKEDFSFKVPFKTELRSNINLDSIELEITDFTYNVAEDELSVHIEYLVTGEQSLIEFAEESDLEDFLQNNDAEIIDLSESTELKEERDKEEVLPETKIIEEESIEEEKQLEKVKDLEKINRDDIKTVKEEVDKETIINSINSDENFITYHVHTVVPNDTVESICNKYNISLNDLKKLNNIDELTINMKLIIADEES